MTSREYQIKTANILKDIFGKDLVKIEWDSAKLDNHSANHKEVYMPRIDIAVGPFNSSGNLDRGEDNTSVMKSHLFSKILENEHLAKVDHLNKIWNSLSRCYLAIEVSFNGSAKHRIGDIINAVVCGSIGMIIYDNQESKNKILRAQKYLTRLENLGGIEINTLKNLIVFSEKQFLDFLGDVRGKL